MWLCATVAGAHYSRPRRCGACVRVLRVGMERFALSKDETRRATAKVDSKRSGRPAADGIEYDAIRRRRPVHSGHRRAQGRRAYAQTSRHWIRFVTKIPSAQFTCKSASTQFANKKSIPKISESTKHLLGIFNSMLFSRRETWTGLNT